jgi:hypothetical protein
MHSFTFSLWNEQSQVYQLDFGGRVTLESAKNFQIEFKGKQVLELARAKNSTLNHRFLSGDSIWSDRKQLLYTRFRMAVFASTSFRRGAR